MRGELVKKDNKWYIQYLDYNREVKYLPLHPDDIEQIKKDALVFDNIEARIKAWPDTPFTICEVWEQVDGETKITRYGKVKSVIEENEEKLQALKSLITQTQGLDTEYKSTIRKLTEEEWQAAERAQTPSNIKEISDEEIEKWVASTPYYGHCTPEYKEGLEEGAKWYREQLKQKNK